MMHGRANAMLIGGRKAAFQTKWNAADHNSGVQLTNDDRTATSFGAARGGRGLSAKSADKWYLEYVMTAYSGNNTDCVGIATSAAALNVAGGQANTSFVSRASGAVRFNGGVIGAAFPFGAGDRIGMAVDKTAGKIWFAVNGAWYTGSDPATDAGGWATIPAAAVMPFMVGNDGCSITIPLTPFYAPPAGFNVWE